MTRPADNEPIARNAEPGDRSERCGSRRRQDYEPPRVESYGKLDKIVQFGGSYVTDSGSNLGRQSGPPFRP